MHFLDDLPLTPKEREDLTGLGARSRLAAVSALRAAGPNARAAFDEKHGAGRFDAVVKLLEAGLTKSERAARPLRPLRGTGGRLPPGRRNG
ncbi:MAG TPA: hypothetical protein VMH79_06170 [Thermoanaerobaculia bacterium]|nr:hypothetical protein [Thermoanaerobaculia bacterium]